ncbi:hypothetical protein [Streptomyces flaveolus]|uniref:hypothetical protein n=1 Tax=Streptomyces flaveolus TaxID=67297 RepID=UPI00341ED653
MSPVSADARAVVAAVDRLTTQVSRVADALSTPDTRTEVTADDAPTTPDDGPCAHHPSAPVIGGVCGGCTQYPADMPAPAARKLAHPVPAEAYAAWTEQAPAADEDQQRTTRREQLHNLLARLDRGGLLSTFDHTRLRALVDDEVREADTVRAVAAGNLRHVQLLHADLQQAQEKAGDLAETCKAERRRGDALAEERNEAWAERDAEQARLRDLLRSESARANSAIDREHTAEQAAEEAQRERDQQAAVLAEVLRHFTEHGHPGSPCVRTPWVRTDTVDRWRSVVQHDVERPWWQQLDTVRAELEQAQAVTERVRALATEPGDLNRYIPRERLLAVLEGPAETEQP